MREFRVPLEVLLVEEVGVQRGGDKTDGDGSDHAAVCGSSGMQRGVGRRTTEHVAGGIDRAVDVRRHDRAEVADTDLDRWGGSASAARERVTNRDRSRASFGP